MSYTTRNGDTFELISRNVYGVATEADRLRAANPGAVAPFPAGVVVKTPALDAPTPLGASAVEQNEVAVTINGQAWRQWETITVTRRLDSLDTYELSGPFEPTSAAFRAAFEPFGFQSVGVTVGGVPLFTGTQLTSAPNITADRRSITSAGYALPGVLGDCSAPASSFPLTFSGLTLRAIVEQVCAVFGIPFTFEAPEGAAFEQVELKPDQTVLQFFIGLAKQRGLVIGNTTAGALVFRKPSASAPVARFTEGLSPLLSITPQFDPQSYYGNVTGIEPSDIGNSGGQQATIKNPFLSGVQRPKTINLPDVAAGELQAATEAAFGRMLASAVSYSASVSTWRNESGGLLAPGDTVRVTAPGAMIYNEYDFLIREITFVRQDVANMTLMLPTAFTGEIPEALPWQ